ncbi:MAG: FGGY-family carbohydrate kinase [Planctomycetia bacterium]|nr:FGGY-family carbohydrate kinase [Planctomycetia bacterium]
MKKIIAYDLGTGGNKASLYEPDGTFITSAFVKYPTYYPKPGFHEQKPDDWVDAVSESTKRLLDASGVSGKEIAAVALSGHSLGIVPLDRDGNLLRETVPIWSDSRADQQANAFFEKTDPALWYQQTGNGFPAPHYSIFKLMWYQENEPEMFGKIDQFTGTKDYVNFRLTGKIATDPSYASGSGVYDLVRGEYDEGLLRASGIDRRIFPEIVPSTEILGPLSREGAEKLGLTPSTLVVAGGVDNSCMALGAGSFLPGRLYASLGSSSWIALCGEKPALDDRTKPYVFAHVVPGMFVSALAIFSSGTTFNWILRHFCRDLEERASREGSNPFDLMVKEAAQSPPGAKGLIMNPSFAGGSSLDPTPLIRGAFLNLDLSHDRSDIIRAAMEGIAANMRIVLDEIRKLADTENRIVVVGGGAISSLWRQIYADLLNIGIDKTNIGQNAASLGAAALAARGLGFWNSFDPIDDLLKVEESLLPNRENREVYKKMFDQFYKTRDLLAQFSRFAANF